MFVLHLLLYELQLHKSEKTCSSLKYQQRGRTILMSLRLLGEDKQVAFHSYGSIVLQLGVDGGREGQTWTVIRQQQAPAATGKGQLQV